MKVKAFLLGLIIELFFMILLIGSKIENDKLKKQVIKLRQENIDYKWQLDQIPYYIKYWCNGE